MAENGARTYRPYVGSWDCSYDLRSWMRAQRNSVARKLIGIWWSSARQEHHRDIVGVHRLPFRRFAKDFRQGGLSRQHHARLPFQELFPARFDMNRPQIRLQPWLSIEVMTVVDHDVVVGIKTVNAISAPIVGAEYRSLDTRVRHEVHCIDRHSLRVEARIH